MRIIAILHAENEEGTVNYPAEPIPENALKIVCDGENYIIYEEGDELPPAPPPAPPVLELSLQEKMQKIVDFAREQGVDL